MHMIHAMITISPFVRDEVLPVVLFFGMFFLIYYVAMPLLHHLPHKKDSIWSEMIHETWEQTEDEAQEETDGGEENGEENATTKNDQNLILPAQQDSEGTQEKRDG